MTKAQTMTLIKRIRKALKHIDEIDERDIKEKGHTDSYSVGLRQGLTTVLGYLLEAEGLCPKL